MEVVYGISSFLVVIVIILLILGLILPKTFFVLPKKSRKRGLITLTSVALVIVLGIALSATEPTSVKQASLAKEREKQARIEQQKQDDLAQQQKLAEEKSQKDTESQTNADKVTAQKAKEDKVYLVRHYWHKITKVIDGDTVKASVDGKEVSIRIIGINAPEYTSKKECYGKNATDHAKELLKDGWIQLEKDGSQSDRDKYSRLLRYVWAGDGSVDFGHNMINDGYAYEYTYNTPYSKQANYKSAQKYASENDKGLWSQKTCDGKKSAPKAKPKVSTPTSTSSPASTAPSTYVAPTPKPQAPAQTGGVVKKSTSGICHAPGTTYYARTKNYISFNSLQSCLNSGGRLPKK